MSQSIRQSFFLNNEFKISDAIIHDTKEAMQTGNFSKITSHTINNHTDSFSIYFTHDIDWLNSSHPYVLVNIIRSAFFKHPWIKFSEVFNSRLFIESIQKLAELESSLGISATYSLGAESGLLLGRHQLRYSSQSTIYQECIQLLQNFNHHIGLHSSYFANQKSIIDLEKTTLESHTNTPIKIHRSHYLNYNTSTLYNQLDQSEIRYDIGFGHSRSIGLRNQFPGKFKPIHSQSGKNAAVTVIPLIMLDNVFFNQPREFVYQSFKDCLIKLKAYNGSACIDFHPENLLIKPRLFDYYKDFIDICKQMGANTNPNY